jgi:hypothetical protein
MFHGGRMHPISGANAGLKKNRAFANITPRKNAQRKGERKRRFLRLLIVEKTVDY